MKVCEFCGVYEVECEGICPKCQGIGIRKSNTAEENQTAVDNTVRRFQRDIEKLYLLSGADDDAHTPLSADAEAFGYREAARVLSEQVAALTSQLAAANNTVERYSKQEDAIAELLGLPESWTLRSDPAVLKAARHVSERVAALEAALEAIKALENVDAAQDMEGSIDFWDGVDTGLSACQQLARKALEGGE